MPLKNKSASLNAASARCCQPSVKGTSQHLQKEAAADSNMVGNIVFLASSKRALSSVGELMRDV